MSDGEQQNVLPQAQPPEEQAPVEIKPVSKVAGGIPSIVSTAKFTWREMGVARGLRTLVRLNQKGGFDCPGCAWPGPDGERSRAKFCEEGAKHVADEATTKRITGEFFEKWTVAELANQSDVWLGQQGRLTETAILRHGAPNY